MQPNVSADTWRTRWTERIGATIAKTRRTRGWSAVQLSARTTESGYTVSRESIAKIESNARKGKMDLSEVAVLAEVLGVSPIELLFPDLPDGRIEIVPGKTLRSIDAVMWFCGEDPAGERTMLARELAYVRRNLNRSTVERANSAVNSRFGEDARRLHDLETVLRSKGWPVDSN